MLGYFEGIRAAYPGRHFSGLALRTEVFRFVAPRAASTLAFALFLGLGNRAAFAQSLLTDNFDSATPGSAYTSLIPGSAFGVVYGNVDILGNITNGGSGFYTCPAGGATANNCLDLNGYSPGAVQSTASFNLTAGVTYTLTFDMAGSVADAGNDPYALNVSLGGSGLTKFVVPAGSGFQPETFTFTPTANEIGAGLVIASATDIPGMQEYGAVIDNLALSGDDSNSDSSVVTLSENFNGAQPGPNVDGAIAGTGFTVTQGNVDVFGQVLNGASTGFYGCPVGLATPGNCIDLNGDQPGAIQSSSPMSLVAGTTYQVSFDLAGNVDDGTHTAYTLNASLGNSGLVSFSTTPGADFTPESFLYTPTSDEPTAVLQFISTSTTGNTMYGPVLDDIQVQTVPEIQSFSDDQTQDTPEPGSVFVLLTGLAGLSRVRRRR